MKDKEPRVTVKTFNCDSPFSVRARAAGGKHRCPECHKRTVYRRIGEDLKESQKLRACERTATVKTYCTTYCNKAHRLSDGKPVRHECHVLPPKALALEVEGRFKEACDVLADARMPIHRGVYRSILKVREPGE